MKRIFLAILLVLGLGTIAYAAGAKFSIDKKLCLGDPATMTDPSQCQESDPVPQGVPVYYMITVTNPWSQPPQTITLTDDMPSEFTPTPTSLFCRDDANQPFVWNPNLAPDGLAIVNLAAAQTIHCFIPGTFTTHGDPKNEVEGTNGDNYQSKSDVTVDVLKTTPITADLAIDKTVAPGTVNVSGGPQTVTYTVTVTNNGPGDVDIGDYFKLHDVMSLLPNSVPLNVQYVSATCAAYTGTNAPSTTTDCLDSAGPQFATGGGALFVGTMNQHAFFTWGFDNGGHITQGEKIVLTITVTVSAVVDLKCVRDPAANGLANKAFFTLADKDNGALADTNIANNTDSANLSVTVPYSSVDPDCAKGQLKVTKKQISPPAGSIVPWGTPVTYEITVQNAALPAQQIVIAKHDLQDWVTEGINTPPFRRSPGKTYCVPSLSSPNLCDDFTPAPTNLNIAGQHNYTYYGESNMGWDTNAKIVLDPTEKIVFHTTFIYDQPDCETVPATPKRPIINTVRVTYKAPPFGAPIGTPDVTQTQTYDAETLMERVKPCQFKVTKKLTSGGPNVQFGVPMTYNVTFTNLDAPRKIGTLFDAARITIPNYATQLPFSSTWSCTASTGTLAVTGFNPGPGSVNPGMATYVGSGAQGAPAAITTIGNNIFFPTGGWISCNVTITVKRPPVNDKFCTTADAYFENVAMMDVTHPFNSNIAWPPTLGWNGTNMANPDPQNRNWASFRSLLPKCWDAHINKTATVGGLPSGSAPWTYPGNPNPVNYTISITNDGDSAMTGPSTGADGWVVTDNFAAPYSALTALFGTCTPGTCWTGGIFNPKVQIGINTLNQGQTSTWTVSQPGGAYPTNPVLPNQDLRNCARINPLGQHNGPGWYNNQLMTMPPPGCPSTTTSLCPPGGSPLIACVTVPVIAVTKISVRKQIVDMTGAGVTTTPANSFQIKVDCSPYDIPSAVNTNLQFSTGASGYSPYQSVYPVPMSGTCSVVETASVTPAAILTKCGGATNVNLTTTSTPLTNPLNPVNNQVTVTNTYTCIGTPQLVVSKKFLNAEVPGAGGGPFPPMTFTVSANCTPATSPVTQTVTTTTNAPVSVTFPVTMGATCTVTEPLTSMPPFPQSAIDFCALQGKVPVWKPVVYNPSSGTVTITQQTTNVLVKNEWKCDTAANGQLEVIKELNNAPGVMFPTKSWTINTNCTPAASASQVVLTTPAFGGAQTTASGSVTAPVNASCTISEVPPLPPQIPLSVVQACAPNGTPQWNVPQYSVNGGPLTTTLPTVTITSGIQTVKVVNGWSCVPNGPPTGQLEIIKELNTTMVAVQFPATAWTINTNCTPTGSANSLTLTTPMSGNAQITVSGGITAPVGANCAVSEVTPSNSLIPSWFQTSCSNQGKIAVWNAPQYSVNGGTPTTTAPNVAITSGVQSVKVINSWSCVSNGTPTGQIEVIKELQTQSTVMQFPQTIWTINANCTPAASSNSLTLTTPLTSNTLVNSSGFVTAPVSANCAISEVTPSASALPLWAKNGCTTSSGGTQSAQWNAPQYVVNGGTPSTTAPNLTVTAGVQTVKIINSWSCKPTSTNSIMHVMKTVTGPTPLTAPVPVTLLANCTPAVTPTSGVVNVTVNPGMAIFVGPSTASCNLTETVPNPMGVPDMVTYCSAQGQGYIPVWLTAQYETSPGTLVTLPVPLTVAMTGNPVIKITNTWGCVPPAVAKKKPKFRFRIGIPIPGIGGGKKGNDGDTRPPPTGGNGRP